MSTISEELLWFDPRQAIIAPDVLLHLRQSKVDYETYLRLLTEDTALGLTTLEWAEQLADRGALSTARECWMASDMSSAEVQELYQKYRDVWEKLIKEETQQQRLLIQECREWAEPQTVEQCKSLLEEAAECAIRDWFDLAKQVLERIPYILEPVLASIEQEQERQEAYAPLSDMKEELFRRLDELQPFPSGPEGENGVQQLLLALEMSLEQSTWDVQRAWAIANLAWALCDGDPYDPQTVRELLGETFVPFESALPPTHLGPDELEMAVTSEIARTASADDRPTQENAELPELPPSQPGVEPDISQLILALPIDIVLVPPQQQIKSKAHQSRANKYRAKNKFQPAEQAFRSALQLWPGNEVAARNLAAMLDETGRSKDAIQVLEKSMLYAKDRLPFYNMLANYHTQLGDFPRARLYALEALKLANNNRTRITILTTLFTIEERAKDYKKALEYVEAVLQLNPQHTYMHKQMERLRAAIASTALQESIDSPGSAIIEERSSETTATLTYNIAVLLREDLEHCEITKVLPQVRYSREPESIFAEVDRLHKTAERLEKLDRQQYRERSDYYLQAAKWILTIPTTVEHQENLTQRLEKSLSEYAGIMGDFFLENGFMDSAREYYLEHMRFYRKKLPKQAFLRIANYFRTFFPDNALWHFSEDNVPTDLMWIVKTSTQEAEEGDLAELGRGLLELASSNDLLLDTIKRTLATSDKQVTLRIRSMLDPLCQYFKANMSDDSDDFFTQLVQARRRLVKPQEHLLNELLQTMVDRYSLESVSQKLETARYFQRVWGSTDKYFLSEVRNLTLDSIRYFGEKSFADKEFLANSIIREIEMLQDEIQKTPTRLGKGSFTHLLARLKHLVQEDFRLLQEVSLPLLDVEVVNSYWEIPDTVRECHLEISNRGDSAAQEVNVKLLPSESGDYMADPQPHPAGSIYAHNSATITLAIKVNEGVAIKDATDLFISLEYADRESRKRKTEPIRLRLPLHDEITFTTIKNPYQTGKPVENPDMFIGREELIKELAYEMTRQGRTSALVIYGQKRSGKTSILKNLASYLQTMQHETYSHIIPLYLSMHTLLLSVTEQIETTLFYLLISAITKKARELSLGDRISDLSWEQLTAPPGASLRFRDYLMQINGLPGVRLVLLIDEFTDLSDLMDGGTVNPALMKFLKSLIEDDLFSCILCGVDGMRQVLAKYANQLAVSDPRIITYLSEESARELIDRPILLPDGRSRFTSDRVIDRLVKLTAGSPYYIQFICDHLVKHMNGKKRSATITGADVDIVVDKLISRQAILDHYTKFDNLCRYGGKPGESREVVLEGLFLYLLAAETRNRPYAPFSELCERASFVERTEFLQMAEQLEERQVIIGSEGSTRQYRIVVDLFRRWINNRHPMDDDELQKFARQLERAT